MDNLIAAWTELELGEECNDPMFTPSEDLTHAAGPGC